MCRSLKERNMAHRRGSSAYPTELIGSALRQVPPGVSTTVHLSINRDLGREIPIQRHGIALEFRSHQLERQPTLPRRIFPRTLGASDRRRDNEPANSAHRERVMRAADRMHVTP